MVSFQRAPTLSTARARLAAAKARFEALRVQGEGNAVALASCKEKRSSDAQRASRAAHHAGGALNETDRAWVSGVLPGLDAAQLDQWEELERAATKRCQEFIGERIDRQRRVENLLVRQMSAAKSVDTGALAEVGSDVLDAPQYLERLRILIEEALPEKQQRFVAYLNQSSDQGVTQLLSDVDNEVSAIEERIADLNQTLQRVDFQSGRYLRLLPRRVVHESLRTLDKAQRALRSAALMDDQGESLYRALQQVVSLLRDAVDKRKTLAARALLDPRHRLQFAVSVIDRATESVIEIRTNSQGGSGGEKEIIASYVLTASLSYALCPRNGARPTFATIVLDEAFSKSSHAVASRIVRALEEFGLHPLFVTPNKELRLLRTHTRSAILIHRKALQATMTSMTWAALEEHAARRSPVSS